MVTSGSHWFSASCSQRFSEVLSCFQWLSVVVSGSQWFSLVPILYVVTLKCIYTMSNLIACLVAILVPSYKHHLDYQMSVVL